MKYFIIAGEASGDIHGSNLVKEIFQSDATAQVAAWGGELMQEAGAQILKHYNELAFMGFAEVLMNLRTILHNFDTCKKQIQDLQPDAIILIDYPGFNLRMARWCKEHGYKVFYYISPQLWAWKSSRIQIIQKYVDRLFVILPFEEKYYHDKNVEVEYVGHPLIEHIANFKKNHSIENLFQKPYILLLPGSRKQEVKKILPKMLSIVTDFPAFHFYIAQAPGLESSFFQKWTQAYPQVHLLPNQTYDLLSSASAALVASGTATLETALFRVPQIVCYAANPLSIWLARKLVGARIRYISLVNLIMDRPVIQELIQADLNHQNLKTELNKILQDSTEIKQSYQALSQLLGDGTASYKVAHSIYNDLKESSTSSK